MLPQLKRGVLEFCVLSIINESECYGYEIMKKITTVFSDTTEQTVYTILRRLLSEQCVECFSKDLTEGPPRKYYRFTEKGKRYLSQCEKDWEKVKDAVHLITNK